jgi:hypothetical protein
VVVNLLLLLALVAAGGVGVAALRRQIRGGDGVGGFGRSGGEDWSSRLADFKNLRDEGVLSEEEFRKIRTLVEPFARIGIPELRERHRLRADPVGSDEARK